MYPNPKGESRTHEELWNQFRVGDIAALEIIYRKTFEDLYQYGMTIYPDNDLVKDTIQELFISLVQHQKTLTAVRSVKFYLLRSLRNRIYDAIGKHKRDEIINEIYNKEQAVYLNGETTSISGEESEEQQDSQLVSVINYLPERQREIVMLIFFEGRTYEEVSTLMSLSIKSAYKLTWKAIKSLKKNLK